MKAVAASSPKVVLLAASVMGKDLGPALSAGTGSALLTDVTSIGIEGGAVVVTKPVYAGKALASIHAETETVVATLRPNVFDPAEPEAGKSAPVEVIEAGVSDQLPMRRPLTIQIQRPFLVTFSLPPPSSL